MSEIRIKEMTPNMTDEVIDLLARAYLTNPINVAALGVDQFEKNKAFFKIGLQTMKGQKYVALLENKIVGMVHWVDSSACQPPELDKLKIAPAMIFNLGLGSSFKIAKWLSAWSAHDPKTKHSHLGPICVAPELQGKGVGRMLLNLYCNDLDQSGLNGYLETDRPENIPIYQKFGFKLVNETPVLGIPNYFMKRDPRVL